MKVRRDRMRLYAVTDKSWLKPGESLAEPVEELLKAGTGLIQLRDKRAGEAELLEEARALKELCSRYQALLIVNDNPKIARMAGADGVHVGLSDMEVEEARSYLGADFIIGCSAHNVEEALRAERAGADYIGCGAVFGSRTKEDAGKLSLEELKEICSAVKIPAVAIGGIGRENICRLSGTGVAGAAVIRALFAAEDKYLAARELMEEVKKWS